MPQVGIAPATNQGDMTTLTSIADAQSKTNEVSRCRPVESFCRLKKKRNFISIFHFLFSNFLSNFWDWLCLWHPYRHWICWESDRLAFFRRRSTELRAIQLLFESVIFVELEHLPIDLPRCSMPQKLSSSGTGGRTF